MGVGRDDKKGKVGKSAGKFRDGHQKSINRDRDGSFVSGIDAKACF
jgi:hypothetical protein